ncbi:aminoglycoside phosphotransferase family protein [Ectobacillus ponti]|uniref:Aminoglycoside phosphotransferase family protein n=1 Tax=Ectobacillus ponti TaxID=2961894 RepID=A0AA41XD94_9BACI|nr:aminoglycoside phosphotransferase family protein [Ectobacillus ponti]MCP8969976.1 aminoglycoside phosphotransferase family protein [Ectobacillus ponti]
MKQEWQEQKVSLQSVKDWLQRVTGAESIAGPTEIFRSNAWGITAAFHARDREYVCKIGFLPVFQTSPAIYRLLGRLHSVQVPKLVAGETIGDQTWLLFEPFPPALESKKALADFQQTAVALAEIQNQAAALIKQEKPDVPLFRVEEVQAACLAFLDRLEAVYQPEWRQNAAQLMEQFHIPEQQLKLLADEATLPRLREQVQQACRVLSHFDCPLSLYHLDLHTGNVVLTAGGRLIFDWEEAVVTLPFFSLSKLLADARTHLQAGQDARWTAEEQEIIESYLDALHLPYPQEERLCIFNIAMCLAPLLYSRQSLYFLQQVGWADSAAGFLAPDVALAAERFQIFSKLYSY